MTKFLVSLNSRFRICKPCLFCSLYLVHKREDMVPAGLNMAVTMETWDITNYVRHDSGVCHKCFVKKA